jgi:thioredoxin-related protein
MLLQETVAVYCENHTEHTDTVRTSQETPYVSATKTSRLMLFKETVAVYCENHTEHTDTVRTSQETPYVSVTKTSRLMLFQETVAVYCENHKEDTVWSESYLICFEGFSMCLMVIHCTFFHILMQLWSSQRNNVTIVVTTINTQHLTHECIEIFKNSDLP